MTSRGEDLTGAALAAARRAGAEAADALLVEEESLSVEVRDGALERAERAESRELGLRVMVGRRQACVAGSDLSDDALARLAERAVAMARAAPEDPTVGLAPPGALAAVRDAHALDILDPAPAPAPAALEARARALENAAAAVAGVSRVDQAGADWQRRHIRLASTNGFSGGYGRSLWALGAVAISGEGTAMERDSRVGMRSHDADLPPPEEIGESAGQRAAARAGARKPPTGAFAVMFDERVAGSLMAHLLAAINGTAIARGASWLGDALGTRVLPAGLDLIEMPHAPRLAASRPFDAEGLATARRVLVGDGVLKGWVLDLATARRLGLESTANAARGTNGPPAPAVSNVVLTGDTRPRAALLAEMGEGLLVTQLMGASINPTTGDYSRGAAGFWIEGGEIAWPVNECTIAGNLREMLPTITAADDADRWRSRQVPSLRVEGLTIAGA